MTERLAHEVFSLPLNPYLDEPTQDFIVEAIHEVLNPSA